MQGLKVYPAIPSFVTTWNILSDIFHTIVFETWRTVKTSLRNNTFKYNFNRWNQVLGELTGKEKVKEKKINVLGN